MGLIIDYGIVYRDDHKTITNHSKLITAARHALEHYKANHPESRCNVVNDGHNGQFTFTGHIPIFLGSDSIDLYSDDPESRNIVKFISDECKEIGLNVLVNELCN